MRTIFFYGLSKDMVWSRLVLLNNNFNRNISLGYHYGALKIDFPIGERKLVGEAIPNSFKSRGFKQVVNP